MHNHNQSTTSLLATPCVVLPAISLVPMSTPFR